MSLKSDQLENLLGVYYRVIALISADIVPSLDIEGRRYQCYYIAINIQSDFRYFITLKTTFMVQVSDFAFLDDTFPATSWTSDVI